MSPLISQTSTWMVQRSGRPTYVHGCPAEECHRWRPGYWPSATLSSWTQRAGHGHLSSSPRRPCGRRWSSLSGYCSRMAATPMCCPTRPGGSAVLGGHRPTDVRAADSDPLLAGLYDETALPPDPAVARALGVRTSLAELLDEPGGADELLSRLADPGRLV